MQLVQDATVDRFIRQANLVGGIQEQLVSLGEQEAAELAAGLKKVHGFVVRLQDHELLLEGQGVPDARVHLLAGPQRPER